MADKLLPIGSGAIGLKLIELSDGTHAFALATKTTDPLSVAGAPFASFAVAIANGESLSGAVDLGNYRLFGIQMDPTAWTAAALTFKVSVNGVDFFDLYDDTGTEQNWTVSAQKFVQVSQPAKWLGIRYIKVRSGTSASPVNQGGARSLALIGVP
jgi:hypothetical protein